jgi:hypothetical protein
VQLSIWPGGASSNAQGTIDWAGGEIDWDSTDIQNYGYDFVTVSSVEIDCYNATSAPRTNNAVSYYYDGEAGTNNTVVNGKNATVLASFLATGTDMDAGASSASASAASSTAQTIPGNSESGGVGSSGTVQGEGSSSSSGDDSGSSSSSSSSDCDTDKTSFTQSCETSTAKSGAAGTKGEAVVGGLGGSAFAAMVAVGVLAWL